MTKALHQLTLTYSAEQDRLMLRISTKEHSEYQLWLTRRFVRTIWKGLVKTIESDPILSQSLIPKVKQALIAMEHQKSIKDSDFSQKHASDNVNLTPKIDRSISTKHPETKGSPNLSALALLVTGAQVKPVQGNLTSIKLKTKANTTIDFSLNKKLLHALCHMMVTSTQKAGWDLNLAIGDPRVVFPTDENQIH
jgi:hypothetical protein